ncbi:hypothetical protein FOZ62_027649, partial [Perkinsus olseni]
VEIDPGRTEHGGVTLIRFTGTSHMAGIVNRTQTECGHPTLKCGEIIWNAEEGWKVDPFTIVSVGVTQNNARHSLKDAPTLRRSYHLTQMSDLCRRGAESYAIDLNGESTSFTCPPGPDLFEYLNEKLPWTDCGYVDGGSTTTPSPMPTTPAPTPSTTTGSSRPHYTAESIRAADVFCAEKASGSYCKYWQSVEGQLCHGTDISCSSLLVEGRRLTVSDADAQTCWARLGCTISERSVHVWTDEAVTPKAYKLPYPWYIGGESLDDLKYYGIHDVDPEYMTLVNLPMRRKGSSTADEVSVTFSTANDVYSMYARPMASGGYFFEGTPSDEFYTMCAQDGENCYGQAAAEGMPEAAVGNLLDIKLSATGGKVMTKEDSGCVDPSKFDDMVRDPASAWGNTAQMAGTYKYLGLTADTDEYISMLPGDFVAMSYLSSITYGQHMVDMMNAGEVDLVVFGNHEFQFKNKCPPADLKSRPEYRDVCVAWNMATGNFLYLSSNVFEDAERTVRFGANLEVGDKVSFVNATVPKNKKVFNEESRYYAASGSYWFKMVKNKKICFTGTTQTSAAKSIAGDSNVWFSDMMESGVEAAREMNEDGCNLVIVLTHQREGYDVLFWRKAVVEEGIKIDAIIGGHDHFPAFLNLQHPTKPDIITPVWKMGMDGQMLGKFVFDFDDQHPNGKLRFAHAIPVFDGQCDKHFIGTANEEWWKNNVMQTWTHWVQPIKSLAETKVDNLLFKGLYNTADIRSAESRVGNMLADLFLRNMSVNIAALSGGNIRYGLSQTFPERIPLSLLYLYEENPFLGGLASYDISAMELFGYVLYSASIVTDIDDAARPVTSGFEVEIDPGRTEHGGVTLIRFAGTSHMAGIVNRTQTECGHPTLKCGEIIWNAEEGWKVDPFIVVTVAVSDYNARYSPNDAPTLRRSYYLTQMSDLCR